jgi:adenine-specific DNA-methyltransferase
MGVAISYMGTKRAIAPAVTDVIGHAQPGTLLDVFSGMCAVGEAVGPSRAIWNNDVQYFASEVARALFTSRDAPMSPLSYGDRHFESFRSHRERLNHSFASSLAAESDLLVAFSFSAFDKALRQLTRAIFSDATKCKMRSPHLFASTYSGTYFGISQAIEADAIVHSLETGRASGATTSDEKRWGQIALGRALLKIANSTGHFAQYLKPKRTTYQRYLRLRRRSLWAEWLTSVGAMSAVGETSWRRKNKVFRRNCLDLLPELARKKEDVSVIYADPPYTDDQYSRYYHLLETLCRYDYPQVSGVGLYRPGRFQTPFSVKSMAAKALSDLIEGCAKTGADLVLSYPTNGLVVESGADIRALLRKFFRRVETSHSIAHKHSTFGASKGAAHSNATELIYFARSC